MSNLTNPAPPRRLILAAGILMVAVSFAGYATVADDLRHVGEIAGVSAILLAGLALIGDAYRVMERWLALRWVAAGVLAGSILGTAIDATLVGLGLGLATGVVLARAAHRSDTPRA